MPASQLVVQIILAGIMAPLTAICIILAFRRSIRRWKQTRRRGVVAGQGWFGLHFCVYMIGLCIFSVASILAATYLTYLTAQDNGWLRYLILELIVSNLLIEESNRHHHNLRLKVWLPAMQRTARLAPTRRSRAVCRRNLAPSAPHRKDVVATSTEYGRAVNTDLFQDHVPDVSVLFAGVWSVDGPSPRAADAGESIER
ncbi:hypothetical protein E4U41_004518 [Claviceps citrina]|nr:hypothetical protein E4U41_004518 [Claviceps citrina]